MTAQPLPLEDTRPATVSVSVVICCYTSARRTLLDRAVTAALGQLRAGDELIVVVDHNDVLHRDLRDTYGEQLLLPANRFRRGLSGARNTGLHAASGDVVVFLDDDAVLHPDALEDARAAFADSTVTALGGAVHPSWQSGRQPAWFPPEFGWVVGCDYRGLPPDGAPIRNPIGAAMAVRRTELAGIGGFCDGLGRVGSLPAGCEETMMGIELARRDPQARIIRRTGFAVSHAVPADRATLRYFARRCFHEGRSKATLSRLCGRGAALRSERAYTTRTLPSGLWHARRRPARVPALVAGLLITTVGYLVGAVPAVRPRKRTP
ncbi:glycosyltransferase family 2 protein [Mycobacterium sp. NAZ190054]|uniref:glycosyltransferase family 2 protein n=1 Tax=Mycobacterium sp. NAZ190054 TaxID=1747766 RepID=UPI000ACEB41B|nr:glycosyltransferase family 2 protein [Mycobacterium sp. NAZ190054]